MVRMQLPRDVTNSLLSTCVSRKQDEMLGQKVIGPIHSAAILGIEPARSWDSGSRDWRQCCGGLAWKKPLGFEGVGKG